MCRGGEKLHQYITAVELPPFVLDTNCTEERHALATLVVLRN